MKNIHLLPTDKYSSLVHSTSKYGGLFKSEYYSPMKEMGDSYQNIYITSDSDIKEGDWFYNPFINEIQINCNSKDCKKIILTTDGDLIKDGVQKIDDEFIEWFVNNPRCEWVEVKKEMYMPFDGKVPFELSLDQSLNTCPHYKIITKDYLQGFIDLHNNELEPWNAVEFLEWLKLNDFKIVKK